MTCLGHLELTNIRCFANWQGDFEPGLNIITGHNGAGKTSLLESIHFLLRQRSFRSSTTNDVISWGSNEGVVVGRFSAEDSSSPQVVGLRKDKTSVTSRLNGQSVQQRSDLVAKFPLICLTPASTILVSGGPGERRQFLDQLLFHVEPSFLPVWRAYRKSLSQRNSLLRSGSCRGIEQWDRQLVQHGEILHRLRTQLVEQLLSPIENNLQQLGQQWTAEFSYRSGWGSQWQADEFAEALLESRDNDLRRATTTRGPHRAELRIVSETKPVTESLSRGQQRILAIALLISQMQLIAERSSIKPLVLIDDIGAELDHTNANKVIDLCASFGGQLLVTALEAAPYIAADRKALLFHVEQ